MGMPMSFSLTQQMLGLSYLTYYGFGLTGSDEDNATQIAQDIQQALPKWPVLSQAWKLVWGPGVFAFEDAVFDDNLMCAFQNKNDPSQYAVAIRGTDPLSISDWLIEDFNILPMDVWPYAKPDKLTPKISKSTATGLYHLQQLVAPEGTPGAGETLLTFLQKNLTEGDSICITGHSLGGALAPTLALWLKDIEEHALAENLKISSIAFAGPTAGNKDFAKYIDQRLENGNLQRVWNDLDIAPYGWQTGQMKKLFLLYRKHYLFPSPIISAAITGVMSLSVFNRYTQVQEKTPPVKGRFKPWLFNYFAQAVYQHIWGYPEALGLLNNKALPVDELFEPSAVFAGIRSLSPEAEH